MGETILEAIQKISEPKRTALAAEAQRNIAAKNATVGTGVEAKPVTGTANDAAAAIANDAARTEAVAVVDAGATKAAPVLKATTMVDEEHGVIMLVGSLADAIDLDGDSVPASLLVKCAHDFCGREDRAFKANHDEKVGARLVESVTGVPILRSGRRLLAGEHIPEDDPMVAVGLVKAAGEATAWVAGVKPDDPAIVQAAKDGKVTGASWGGFAQRSPLAQ